MHDQYNSPVGRAVAAYPTGACAARLLRGYHGAVSIPLFVASQTGMLWTHTDVGANYILASPLYLYILASPLY